MVGVIGTRVRDKLRAARAVLGIFVCSCSLTVLSCYFSPLSAEGAVIVLASSTYWSVTNLMYFRDKKYRSSYLQFAPLRNFIAVWVQRCYTSPWLYFTCTQKRKWNSPRFESSTPAYVELVVVMFVASWEPPGRSVSTLCFSSIQQTQVFVSTLQERSGFHMAPPPCSQFRRLFFVFEVLCFLPCLNNHKPGLITFSVSRFRGIGIFL